MVTEDLNEIISIENASFSIPWTKNMFLQELHLKMSRNFVAKIETKQTNEIVGYMTCWVVAGEIHIQRIATRKEARRSGIASELMRNMIRHSTEYGCTCSTLEVGRSNEGAIKLYENFGFSIQGVRPLYYKERGEDALIMGADLTECKKLICHEP